MQAAQSTEQYQPRKFHRSLRLTSFDVFSRIIWKLRQGNKLIMSSQRIHLLALACMWCFSKSKRLKKIAKSNYQQRYPRSPPFKTISTAEQDCILWVESDDSVCRLSPPGTGLAPLLFSHQGGGNHPPPHSPHGVPTEPWRGGKAFMGKYNAQRDHEHI